MCPLHAIRNKRQRPWATEPRGAEPLRARREDARTQTAPPRANLRVQTRASLCGALISLMPKRARKDDCGFPYQPWNTQQINVFDELS